MYHQRAIAMAAGVLLVPVALLTCVSGCGAEANGGELMDLLSAWTGDGQAAALGDQMRPRPPEPPEAGTQARPPQGVGPEAGGLPVEMDRPVGHGPHHGPHHPPPLTEEQIAAIEVLREQLNLCEITLDEACAELREIIGEPPCGPPLPPIDLTEEQLEQALAIFAAARDDIIALHEVARDEVLAVLTEEQLALLEELLAELPPPPPPMVPGWPLCAPPEEPPCPQPPRVPFPLCPPPPEGEQDPGPGMGGPGGPGGHGGPGEQGEPPDGGPMHQRLPCLQMAVELFGFTEDQVIALETIHDELRAAVEARQQEAWEAFLAILTEEQLEQLEQLPPPPPPPPGGEGSPPPRG